MYSPLGADEVKPERNPILYATSGLFLFGAIVAGSAIFVSGLTQLMDLQDLSNIDTTPTPCGVAVPDVADIMYGVGIKALPLPGLSRSTADSFAGEVERALCSNADPVDVMKVLWGEDDRADVTDAASVAAAVCDKGDGRRMDPLSRVTRAYIRAHPGFAHYQTRSQTGVCAWTNRPFMTSNTGCTNADLVEASLQTAAEDFRVVTGSYGALPSMEVMLYRLLALAVISEDDYSDNRGLCFKNSANDDAVGLCTAAYDGYSAGTAPSPPTMPYSTAVGKDQYKFSALYLEKNHMTCDRLEAVSPMSPPAPSAPAPDLVLHGTYEGGDTTTWTVEHRHCVRTHELGLYDMDQLFGMPDHEGNPNLRTYNLGGIYETNFLKPYFYSQRKNLVLQSPQRELMVFVAARVATSMFYLIPALCVIGFWGVFGGLPLAAQSIAIVRSIRGGTFPPINRPPASIAQTATSVASVYVSFYILLYDPVATPSYPRSSCENYGSTGHVWSNSDTFVRGPAIVAGSLILVMGVGGFLYGMFLRRQAVTINPQYVYTITNRSAQLLAIFGIAVLIVFDGLLLAETLGDWDSQVKHYSDEAALVAQAKVAYNDGVVSMVSALCGSAAVSAISDAHFFKSPKRARGSRILWLVLVLGLAGLNLIVDASMNGDANSNREGRRQWAYVTRLTVFVMIAASTALNWRDMDQEAQKIMSLKWQQKAKEARAARAGRNRFGMRRRVAPMLANAEDEEAKQPILKVSLKRRLETSPPAPMPGTMPPMMMGAACAR
ncbi:MAG: hypothetical protein ACKVI4_15920 [Actinomycetales bacterium]